MNRNRQQRTPAGAASDGVLASQEVVLGSELPRADTQAGEGRRINLVLYSGANNYVTLDPEGAGIIEFMIGGKLIKPRLTCVEVNGVREEVLVLRAAASNET